MAFSGLFIKQDNMKRIMDDLTFIVSQSVYVGFPDGGAARSDPDEPSNAMLAFIHEHGSPKQNIPARPFMIPGAKAAQARAVRLLRLAATQALEGQRQKAVVTLNQLGLIGVASVQRAITIGAGWPPLALVTIQMRRAKGRTGTHPLIDTGQLRQHVTYVIRSRPQPSLRRMFSDSRLSVIGIKQI